MHSSAAAPPSEEHAIKLIDALNFLGAKNCLARDSKHPGIMKGAHITGPTVLNVDKAEEIRRLNEEYRAKKAKEGRR